MPGWSLFLYLSYLIFLTKITDLTFIGFHNFWLESYRMVVTKSMRLLSCHDDARACSLTIFVSYPINKFILTPWFSYLWLCHISILTPCHILSAYYVRVWFDTFCLFSLCIHSWFYLFSFCLHAGFDISPFYINAEFDYLFFWSNHNHISNTLLGREWSHLYGIYMFPPHDCVTKKLNRVLVGLL